MPVSPLKHSHETLPCACSVLPSYATNMAEPKLPNRTSIGAHLSMLLHFVFQKPEDSVGISMFHGALSSEKTRLRDQVMGLCQPPIPKLATSLAHLPRNQAIPATITNG
ncbi:hypothetical protein IAQ61_007592 [Plenodomus lingam]|nr:hypothetical protein IAQ61_007592 [Plenodomus lingam]